MSCYELQRCYEALLAAFLCATGIILAVYLCARLPVHVCIHFCFYSDWTGSNYTSGLDPVTSNQSSMVLPLTLYQFTPRSVSVVGMWYLLICMCMCFLYPMCLHLCSSLSSFYHSNVADMRSELHV